MEAEYWTDADGWLRDYFPTTIVKDRYDGCHSGGAWLAFPDDSEDLPPFIEDDDPYIWKRTTWVYGRGESPAEAFSNLVSVVKDIIREGGLELRSSIYTK